MPGFLAEIQMRIMFISIIVASLAIAGCNDGIPSSDQKMNKQQEDLANEAVMQVGMPSITNFQEKRMMKSVIEARDRTIATTTYVMAQNTGQLFKLCDSIGYGLPYATQYTNPMKLASLWSSTSRSDGTAIPQADPNGLFSPAAAEATWIFCLDPATKKDKPVYVEPRVIVAPFPIALTPVEFAK
jgi:hypothetical protein